MPTIQSTFPNRWTYASSDSAQNLSIRASEAPSGNRLSSAFKVSDSSDNQAPQTYDHLSKTMTREELDPTDLRDSLKQLASIAGIARGFDGVSRSYDSERADYDAYKVQDSPTGKLFSLTVTTQDGDEVEIVINNKRGHDKNLGGFDETSISFQVNGELDEGEQQALMALTGQLGGMADDYLSEDWAKLGSLDIFNENELSGFSVNIGGHTSESFEIDYQVDQQSKERRLSANQNGYEFNLSAQLDGLYLDDDVSSNAQYQQYRDLIASTALSYRDGEQSAVETTHFFQDGLDALFRVSPGQSDDEQVVGEPEATQGVPNDPTSPLPSYLNNKYQGLLKEFSSGLPDFSASFSTPTLIPNPSKPDEFSMMTLSFSQATTVTEQREGEDLITSLNQRSEYEASVRQFTGESEREAGPGGSGNYEYENKHSQASIDRSLSFKDHKTLVAAGEDRTFDQRVMLRQVLDGETENEDVKRSNNDSQEHYQVANTYQEKQKAQQQLENYRTIEQLKDFIDGSQVSLFDHAKA